MKYIKTIFLLLVVFLTCGCGKRDSISPQDFLEKLKNYDLVDVKSTINFADSAYKVTGNNNLEILYIKCSNKNTIKQMYYDETNNITKKAAAEAVVDNPEKTDYSIDDIEKSITKGDNYTIAGYDLKNKYYRLSWVDDTIIIASIDAKNKSELVNLLKSFNY